MNRLAKYTFVGLAIVPVMAFAQSSRTIYKFVDENGRVHYANTPIKGGTKVDLEPLTIMPSSPGTASTTAAPTTTATRAIPVAKVTSVPSPAYSVTAAPAVVTAPAAIVTATPAVFMAATIATPTIPAVASTPAAPPPIVLAALETGDKTQERAQQRRADIRQRILQNEIQAEEKSMGEARTALADEQRKSGEIRAMRASFAATATAATPQKPLISPEVRAEIERHFERVRNLQDQVAMHEGSIAAMRGELQASK